MEIIAHRGMHSDTALENSAEAIRGVLASVADGIEFDTRLTKDNVCIVYHNDKLKSGQAVSELTLREIHDSESNVTRVQEALEILGGGYQGLINIEIKHYYGEKGHKLGPKCIEELICLLNDYHSKNYLFSSFSFRNLALLKNRLENTPRALLLPFYIPTFVAMTFAKRFKCSAVHVSLKRSKSIFFRPMLKEAHRNNIKVRVYTVNATDDFKRLVSLGVDGIFTDRVIELNSTTD